MGVRVSTYTDPDRPTSTVKYGNRTPQRKASYSSRFDRKPKPEAKNKVMDHNADWRKPLMSVQHPGRKVAAAKKKKKKVQGSVSEAKTEGKQY